MMMRPGTRKAVRAMAHNTSRPQKKGFCVVVLIAPGSALIGIGWSTYWLGHALGVI